MPPEKNPKRPEAAATAIEASGNKATEDLTDHSKALYDTSIRRRNTNCSATSRKVSAANAETVIAQAPVPRGFARISVVQDKRGPVIHARRWYEAEDGPRGTREGFTVDRADHARTLADGLLKAADVLDRKPGS